MDRETSWTSLMQAARSGDASACEKLLGEVAEALRPVVASRLAHLHCSETEAEDVLQEILIAIHCKGHTWDDSRPILPWIYAVTKYKILDAMRRSGRRRAVLSDIGIDELEDRMAAPATETVGPHELAQLLDHLPERQRGVVSALALKGDTVANVARDNGLREGAVRVAFHRGLKTLRKLAG